MLAFLRLPKSGLTIVHLLQRRLPHRLLCTRVTTTISPWACVGLLVRSKNFSSPPRQPGLSSPVAAARPLCHNLRERQAVMQVRILCKLRPRQGADRPSLCLPAIPSSSPNRLKSRMPGLKVFPQTRGTTALILARMKMTSTRSLLRSHQPRSGVVDVTTRDLHKEAPKLQ